MSQYKEKTMRRCTKVVNYTQMSYQKYDSVKINNFVAVLQLNKLPPLGFATEVQAYFRYHSERK